MVLNDQLVRRDAYVECIRFGPALCTNAPQFTADIRQHSAEHEMSASALYSLYVWLLSLPHHHTTTVLRPFFRDQQGEPVPEEKFWTLWCNGRLTEADTLTIRLCATPSGLTSAHLHHPPFFTGQRPFLPPNQQCQSTGGNWRIRIREKTLEFSSMVLTCTVSIPLY